MKLLFIHRSAAFAGTVFCVFCLFSHSCVRNSGTIGQSLESPYDHVILLGFDGLAGAAIDTVAFVAPDLLMPNLREMIALGAWTTHKRSVLPTSSAVNWATMFMGAGPEVHGYIEWDSKAPHFTSAAQGQFPTVFTALKQACPDAVTAASWQWDGIKYVVDTASVDVFRGFRGDVDGISEEAHFVADYIMENKPRLGVFTWDYPDHTGHTLGWYTPDYYNILHELDRAIGTVKDAVAQAGIANRTLIIISSDHGGHKTWHGNPVDSDLFAPLVLYGRGVKQGYEIPVCYQYDIASTILYALGVPQPDLWRGVPIESAFENFFLCKNN